MTVDREAVRSFFRQYGGTAVGATPIQPNLQPEEEDPSDAIDRTVEFAEEDWKPIPVSEAPARQGED